MDADDGRVEQAVLQIKHLPPLSVTATRLLEAITDDEIDLKELADIIEQDPGLAARIIGLANSAYFAQPSPVYSVEEAIIRVLGLNMVKSLALGITVAGVFDCEQCPQLDLVSYWFEALAVGQLARALVMVVPVAERPDINALYLGGLFHNLGMLLLAHVDGSRYGMALSAIKQRPDEDPFVIEQELLGVDRRQAAHWLGVRWHLPELLNTLMLDHCRQTPDSESRMALKLLNSAVEWVKQVRTGEAYELQDCQWLQQVKGLNRGRLEQLEENFRAQMDELELVARQLA